MYNLRIWFKVEGEVLKKFVEIGISMDEVMGLIDNMRKIPAYEIIEVAIWLSE